ncbi:uncharacterized protein TNCV_3859801 [Trichonephila clavipes]|nr:uncharacterized protein TNCV_3859801 [Trichonephila clavipes]
MDPKHHNHTEILSGPLSDFLEDEASLRDLSHMWYQHDGAPADTFQRLEKCLAAGFEQLSVFERGCIIRLKKAGWANRRITRHMGRRDAAIRRCCKNGWKMADFSVMMCLATNSASNCVLTIIEEVSWDAQGSMSILLSLLHATQVLNQKLWSGAPFLLTAGPIRSPLMAHLQQWYFDDILRTVLLPFLLQYPGLIFQQDNSRPHMERVAMNYLTAC